MSDIKIQLTQAATLHRAGHVTKAMELYENILSLNPQHADTLHLYGMGHFSVGSLEQAVNCLSKAITLDSTRWIFHLNLGLILRKQGALEEAVKANRTAAKLAPEVPAVHFNLGRSLEELNLNDEAITSYRTAIKLDPKLDSAFNNLGILLRKKGLVTEAIHAFETAITLCPHAISARTNLAGCYKDISRTKEAVEHYRTALQLDSAALSGVHSNLLFAMNYSEAYSPSEVFEAHLEWAKLHELPLLAEEFPTLPSPNKKLRVGFVSADFKVHSVAFFITPILAAHQQRGNVEVICYSDVSNPDTMTARIKEVATTFHSTYGWSDSQVADQVRKDEIDILIDLAGHTGNHRLLLFALKPAPVQATYLGYPNTTGMRSIQYRITDSIADPAPQADALHSETLIRIPNGFHCFAPPKESPEVGPLPALSKGHITFGSFNNLAKVTPEVVRVWAQILNQVDNSKLLIKASTLRDPKVIKSLTDQFETHSVPKERLQIVTFVLSLEEHLRLYHQIDIGLDPFPYNGTTTTCEAFWMGVPVISLVGNSHPGRVGMSLLDQVGLANWGATNKGHYVDVAKQFSQSTKDLADLRQALRGRMQGSQLTQAPLFAQALEGAYATMVSLERESRE